MEGKTEGEREGEREGSDLADGPLPSPGKIPAGAHGYDRMFIILFNTHTLDLKTISNRVRTRSAVNLQTSVQSRSGRFRIYTSVALQVLRIHLKSSIVAGEGRV